MLQLAFYDFTLTTIRKLDHQLFLINKKVNYPQLDHEAAFQKAKELNLNITIHAGEVGGTENVKRAVRDYGATRIGHGYRIVMDEDLMDEMKQKNIHFEACPTSSFETGGWQFDTDEGKDWKKHPAVKMLDHGLRYV